MKRIPADVRAPSVNKVARIPHTPGASIKMLAIKCSAIITQAVSQSLEVVV